MDRTRLPFNRASPPRRPNSTDRVQWAGRRRGGTKLARGGWGNSWPGEPAGS
ncbi:hypothetical protein JMJ76_0000647, partial [Colletotrichum scovillei]